MRVGIPTLVPLLPEPRPDKVASFDGRSGTNMGAPREEEQASLEVYERAG